MIILLKAVLFAVSKLLFFDVHQPFLLKWFVNNVVSVLVKK